MCVNSLFVEKKEAQKHITMDCYMHKFEKVGQKLACKCLIVNAENSYR